VDSVDKLTLTKKPGEKSIEEVREWVNKQIGPTLAMLMIYDEGELTELFKIINSGKHRLKKRHFQILSNARRSNRANEL
jgi:hypothetical protein